MNILGINASPRREGNTWKLLEAFLGGAEGIRSEAVVLNSLDFSPCQECEDLPDDNKRCIVRDELQEIFPKVDQADIIAFASPIFFGSLSAQAKMFIDRFQCHWRAEDILGLDLGQKKKKGVFLCVEASERDDFQLNAKAIVKNFFATVNAAYSGEILCQGVDEKGAILKRPGILEEAAVLGKSLSTHI